MKELLSTKEKVYLDITSALLGEPIDIYTLADELFMSVRNLKKYIDDLNVLIHPISIYFIDTNSVNIHYPDSLNYQHIYKSIYVNNLNYSLLELLFLEENNTLETLEEHFFLSESTLRRTISFINQRLAPFDIIIDTKNFNIIGDEKNIIQFFVSYFQEKYTFQDIKLGNSLVQFLDYIYSDFTKFLNFPTNFPTKNRFIFWVGVGLKRIERNHSLPINNNSEYLTQFTHFFDALLKEQHNQKLKLEHNLTSRSFAEALTFFIETGFLFSNDGLNQLIEKHPDLRDNYQKISYILLELEEIFTISMTESAKTNMQLKLMNGFTFYQKLIFKGGLLNDVPLQFKQRTLFIINRLPEIIQRTFKKYFPHEDEWMANYFIYIIITHWDTFIPNMLKKAPIIHVGIVVETDLEHALYLKNKLAYYYPFNLDAMLIPDITTERIDNKKLDIILTTFPLHELSTTTKIISINHALSKQNVNDLYSSFGIFFEKKLEEKLFSGEFGNISILDEAPRIPIK
ncbi:MAG: helix-turn-helix domain-containing protein [Carnobacterium sp.]|uniref:helix-turn-helix domain-containing protein n=1 Tax=Carnobacterium TaxID=2747 RepID=UPI002FC82C0F